MNNIEQCCRISVCCWLCSSSCLHISTPAINGNDEISHEGVVTRSNLCESFALISFGGGCHIFRLQYTSPSTIVQGLSRVEVDKLTTSQPSPPPRPFASCENVSRSPSPPHDLLMQVMNSPPKRLIARVSLMGKYDNTTTEHLATTAKTPRTRQTRTLAAL